MWRAVVLQALLDAAGLGRSLNPSWPEWKHEKVRQDAIDWLLGDSEDFSTVCASATIPEEALKILATRIADGDADAKKSLIEWRDTFAKQGRKTIDGMEVEQEPNVSDEIF